MTEAAKIVYSASRNTGTWSTMSYHTWSQCPWARRLDGLDPIRLGLAEARGMRLCSFCAGRHPSRKLNQEQGLAAADLAGRVGVSAAARRYGVGESTIQRWILRARISTSVEVNL